MALLSASLWETLESTSIAAAAEPQAYRDVDSNVERFLNGAIRLSLYRRSDDLWCDGVLGLRLMRAALQQIDAVGVAIWAEGSGGFYLAPFECEFRFSKPNSVELERTMVRFGVAGRNNEIVKVGYEQATPEKLILDRPKKNTDWAIAIQIDER